MTSPLKEAVGYAQASLWEVLKHTEEIETLPERKDGYATLVAVTEKELAAATAALKIDQAELERVLAELAPKQRQLEDLRARAEAQISEQIDKANAVWSALVEKITGARDGIAAVDASFGSLRKRLDIAA